MQRSLRLCRGALLRRTSGLSSPLFTSSSSSSRRTCPVAVAVAVAPAALSVPVRGKSCCAASQYGEKSTGSGSGSGKVVTHYSKLGMDGFTDVRYNTAADAFLEHIESVVDALGHPAVEDINCSGGVLTLETAEHGTFIINKQAPNVQLWLSSPISGPHHYDMVVTAEEGEGEGGVVTWISDHDGHDMQKRLEDELSELLGSRISLS